MSRNEFSLITHYFSRAVKADSGVDLAVGDDGALLSVPQGEQLVVSTDSLVAGTHFLVDANPVWVGHKALASNISDIVAMGATPRWVSLALTLPSVDEQWLTLFCEGFFALIERYNLTLVGGDTTQGPLSITVTIHGTVPNGKAWLRSGAQVGDDIYISAPLGESQAGLDYILDPDRRSDDKEYLIAQHFCRWPRAELVEQLRGKVNSALDISDGLVADLGHILTASSVGAELDINLLPLTGPLLRHSANNQELACRTALSSGEEYALCFTAPAMADLSAAQVYKIGRINDKAGQLTLLQEGIALNWSLDGYDHFGA
ncbi:thiamine-phosphate kinase [Thaumasiovibrio sp. DFM-14]|uniref:thiamine-phosphate kinase n=1 Tax=Thaumasiovibrio sp. DFM-14 TaxID=3384792 RepID=UPI0039A02145